VSAGVLVTALAKPTASLSTASNFGPGKYNGQNSTPTEIEVEIEIEIEIESD